MSQIAVIYWSQTGNTEQMANAICEGIKSAGGEAVLLHVADTSAQEAAKYGRMALGCPRFWKKLSLTRSSPNSKAILAASASHCSAPMVGAMASGCATGSSVPMTQVHC